jgi:hypothetical protein
MNNLQKIGFDNWFKDKVDLSKTADLKIARVISVNKNTQRLGRSASAKPRARRGGFKFFN